MFSKVFRWVAKAAAVTVAGVAAKELARNVKRLRDEKRTATSSVADIGNGMGNKIHTERDVVEDADRSTQHAPDGTSLVDEWGEESFPASDAPQSW